MTDFNQKPDNEKDLESEDTPLSSASQRESLKSKLTLGSQKELVSSQLSPVSEKEVVSSDFQIWGDYEVQGKLGQGAMGAVYKGRQISLDRMVALKVLPPQFADDENFVKRFELEAKAIARISSPHVVQMYSAGNHEGQEYFAMEYVKGEDLGAKLENGYKPSFDESMDIIQQAARGLAAAEEFGIIHRDIKPTNMMVTDQGKVKLMDFGLVKIASSESVTAATLTRAGTLIGTVNYISPEQSRGEICDQRSDIYSLGIVLYELLTGKLPFKGDSPASVIYQHNFLEPTKPKDIDPTISEYHQAIALKCMQKKPENRYQSALEIISDIELIKKWSAPVATDGERDSSIAFLADGSLTEDEESTKDKPQSSKPIKRRPKIKAQQLELKWQMLNKPIFRVALGVVLVSTLIISISILRLETPDEELSPFMVAEKFLKEGKYLPCRKFVINNLANSPKDKDWLDLLDRLNQQEGMEILEAATDEFNRNNIESCKKKTERASELLPRHPKTKKLIYLIQARTELLQQGREFLNAKNYEECRKLANEVIKQLPHDDQWTTLLKQLNVQEGQDLINNVIENYYSKDVDSVRNKLNKALEYLPGNKKVIDLLASFNGRIKDLDSARKFLKANEFVKCDLLIKKSIQMNPRDRVWLELKNELKIAEMKSVSRTKQSNLREKIEIETQENAYHNVPVPPGPQITNYSKDLGAKDGPVSPSPKITKTNEDQGYHGKHVSPSSQQIANYEEDQRYHGKHVSPSPKITNYQEEDGYRDEPDFPSQKMANYQEEDGYRDEPDFPSQKMANYDEDQIYLDRLTQLTQNRYQSKEFDYRTNPYTSPESQVDQLLMEREYNAARSIISDQLMISEDDLLWRELKIKVDKVEGNHFLTAALIDLRKHHYRNARTKALKALKLRPKSIAAREMLTLLNSRKRKLKAAEDLLNRGNFFECRNLIDGQMTINPDDIAWLDTLDKLNKEESHEILKEMAIAFAKGDLDLASSKAQTILVFSPHDPTALEILRELSERDRALDRARKLLDEGNFSACRELINKNIVRFPNDKDWLSLRSELPSTLHPPIVNSEE